MSAFKCRACLFDMDGTLIDSEKVWIAAIRHAMGTKGIQLEYEQVAQIEYGHAWLDIFQTIRTTWPDAFQNIQEMEAITGVFYDEYTARESIAIEPSVTLLKALCAQGYAIGIVTGSIKTRINQTIRNLGLEKYVSTYVGAGDYVRGKPAPDSYLEAARRLNISPENCIAFEDSPAGVTSAKNAGMKCVALKRPLPFDVDLSLADLVMEDLSLFRVDMLSC